MTRLIDADALIEDIKSFWDWDSIDGITATTVLKQTISDISHAPTIEAVPVVRCKNCKHRYITGSTTHYYVCDFMDAEYNDNGYCHHGERKDNEID